MFITRHLPTVMFRYNADGAQGGDGGNGQQQGGNQGQQTTQSQSNGAASGQGTGGGNGDGNQGLASLLAKFNNDAMRVAETLLGDNFKLREKNRQLEGQVEGAVVLRDADKTSWDAYKALGTPSEVATKLRRGEIERVANRVGYDADVFADLDRQAGGKLVYEVKTETVEGKATERVYVRDDSTPNAAPQLLSDFATAKWSKYLPALQPAAQSQGQSAGGGQGAQAGTRYPAQGTGGGAAASSDYAAQFLKKQEERNKGIKNPLLDK